MKIGSEGLAQVDLTIPQGTTLSFTVTHTDEQGQAVDHSGSTAHMAIKDKRSDEIVAKLDDCCTCTSEGIYVLIPATSTAEMPIGTYPWDLMVETSALKVIRMCQGTATIIDTYAMDGE